MFFRKRYVIGGALALCGLVTAEVRGVLTVEQAIIVINDPLIKTFTILDKKNTFTSEEEKTILEQINVIKKLLSDSTIKNALANPKRPPSPLQTAATLLNKLYTSVNTKLLKQQDAVSQIETLISTIKAYINRKIYTELEINAFIQMINKTLVTQAIFLSLGTPTYINQLSALKANMENELSKIKQPIKQPAQPIQQPQAPVQPVKQQQIQQPQPIQQQPVQKQVQPAQQPAGIVANVFALLKKTVPKQAPALTESWKLADKPAQEGWQRAMKTEFWTATLDDIATTLRNQNINNLIGIKKTLDATDEVFQKNKAIVLGQATGDAQSATQEILNMKNAFDKTVKKFIQAEKAITADIKKGTITGDNTKNVKIALDNIKNQIRRMNLTIYIAQPPIIVTNTQMEKDIEPLKIIEAKLLIPIPHVNKTNAITITNDLEKDEKGLLQFQVDFTTKIIPKYSKPENFNVYDPVIMDISRRIKAALCTIENRKAQLTDASKDLKVFPPLLSNLELLYNQLVIETNRPTMYVPNAITGNLDATEQSVPDLTKIQSQIASALFTLNLYKNNPLFAKKDTQGNPKFKNTAIVFKDANGNIMYDYKRDANGNAININGNTIVLKTGELLQENVNIVWLRDNTGKKIPLTKSGPDGKPLMEIELLDIPQNIVADSTEDILNKILILEKSFQALLTTVLAKLDTLDKGCRVAYLAALTALDTLKLKYNAIAISVNASSLITQSGPPVNADFAKEAPNQIKQIEAEKQKLVAFQTYNKVQSIMATFNMLITNYNKFAQMILKAQKGTTVLSKGLAATRAPGIQTSYPKTSSQTIIEKAKTGGAQTKQKR